MKLCVVIFGVLAACAVSYAVEHGPLLRSLQSRPEPEMPHLVVDPSYNRQKRSLLLGAGLLGAGAVGAGIIGAGLIGAKAGFIGGAIASRGYHGSSYGGYHGHSYGGYYGSSDYSDHYYTSPSYYGGHRHYYTSPTYYEDSHYYAPSYYSGYRSYYPEEYVIEEGSDWC